MMREWKDRREKLLDAKHFAVGSLEVSQKVWEEASADKEAAEEAVEIVSQLAKDIQERAHKQIAAIVSRCLQAIFGPDAYEFQCQFEKKRNKTEVKFRLCRGDVEISPLDAVGGGVVDVVAFALRVASLRFRRKSLRQLLVLDEPFKFLSKEYRPYARQMIEDLAEELGIQFIIVTHDPEYEIGKIIRIGKHA